MRKTVYLFVLLLLITNLVACSDGVSSEKVIASLDNKSNDVTQQEVTEVSLEASLEVDQLPIVTPGNNTDSIEEKLPLAKNEYYLEELVEGQTVINLVIDKIEFASVDVDSYIIHFKGELQLTGIIEYISDENKSNEISNYYFIVSESSLENFPRSKRDDMNFSERIAIINANQILDSYIGKELTANFDSYVYASSMHKPLESTINIIDIVE